MSNENQNKKMGIGLVEKVAYGAIGVSYNTEDNEIFFVTANNAETLEIIKNKNYRIVVNYFGPSKTISINTMINFIYSYINSNTNNFERPGLILRYKDLENKQKTYLLMLTEKGELKEIFKEYDAIDIDFLGARNTVNEENPEPEFSYKLVVYDKALDEYKSILAFIDSNGNITKIHENKDGQIYYLKESNRYQYMNSENELLTTYYDSFGMPQLENVHDEILVSEIDLKDMLASGKFNIYIAINQDGISIAYMINAETGKLVMYLNPEIDCVQIFNEFLFKFGKGDNTPYIRRQEI